MVDRPRPIASCALGMGSKQTMVDGAADRVVVGLDVSADARRGDAFSACAARPSTAVCRSRLRRGSSWRCWSAMERWPHSIGFAREGWTPWTYLLTQTGVIVHYLRLSIVPSPLALDYDGWPMARLDVLQCRPVRVPLPDRPCVATVVAIVRRQPWGFPGALVLRHAGAFVERAPAGHRDRRRTPHVSAACGDRRRRGCRRFSSLAANGFHGPARRSDGDDRSHRCATAGPRRRRSRDFVRRPHLRAESWITGATSGSGGTRSRSDRPIRALGQLWGSISTRLAGWPEAERELREAVRLKDTSAAAHANLGPVLCALGQTRRGHLSSGARARARS